MFDAIVIGAGITGAFVARELTRYKLNVCIVESMSDVAMGATRANSAIIHAGFDAKEGSLKALLNVRGSEMMEELARELGVKYQRCGSIVVGFGEQDLKTLYSLKERGEKNGVKGLSVIDRKELLSIEPNIGDGVTHALVAPTGAISCPYELCMAAVGNAMDNGACLKLNFKVNKILKSERGYIVSSDNESIEAKYVINCAGIYADEIAGLVGDTSFSINPRRGEYMLLDKEAGTHVSHTIFRCPSEMGKGILVSLTVDGNLLLGPTAENTEDKANTATTQAGFADIRRQANEEVSGIPFAKVITSFSGLRATGNTGDFIINSPKPGFINVAGIESPGLSAAPAIAEYVVKLIEDGGEPLEKREDFISRRRSLHYFKELSADEKMR